VLLTASLGVGAVYWLGDTTTVNALKLSVTVGVWVSYIVVLTLRLRDLLVGKRLAWVLLTLFAALLATLPLISGSHAAP